MRTTAKYSAALYRRPLTNEPIIMTGTSLKLFERTCVGYATLPSAALEAKVAPTHAPAIWKSEVFEIQIRGGNVAGFEWRDPSVQAQKNTKVKNEAYIVALEPRWAWVVAIKSLRCRINTCTRHRDLSE